MALGIKASSLTPMDTVLFMEWVSRVTVSLFAESDRKRRISFALH